MSNCWLCGHPVEEHKKGPFGPICPDLRKENEPAVRICFGSYTPLVKVSHVFDNAQTEWGEARLTIDDETGLICIEIPDASVEEIREFYDSPNWGIDVIEEVY